MADNQEQPTQEQLSQAADEMMGVQSQVPPVEGTESVEGQPSSEIQSQTEQQTQASVKPQNGQAIPPELKEILDSTPYKADDVVESVKKLVEGYKNLQGRDTQLSQKVKPYQQLLDKAERDPNYAEYLRTADRLYSDPALQQQYMSPQFQRPDPMRYDMTDPQHRAAYDAELDRYFEMKMDAKWSSRFAQTEQQNLLNKYETDFRAKYPSTTDNPNELLDWARSEAVKMNPYETAYKLKNWDNRETDITEKVRKEITNQIEKAAHSTPQSSASANNINNATEIMKHVSQYGMQSAIKRYKEDVVMKTLREQTNREM